jgi:hypothetical protein
MSSCGRYLVPTPTPSFVTVTFGGADVQNNHFFSVNGNTSVLTNNRETAVGNIFRFGAPMRLFMFTFHKSHPGQAIFQLIRNQTPSLYIVNGSSGGIALQSPIAFDTQEIIRLRSIVNGGSPAPGATLITLYFYAVPEQAMLYHPIPFEPENTPGLYLITFGGANNNNLSFLRFNGNATSPVNNQPSAGNVFVAGSPLTIFRVVWHKSAPTKTRFDIITNNVVSDVLSIDGQSGMADVDYHVKQLDTFQLMVMRFPPGDCLLTFYARM